MTMPGSPSADRKDELRRQALARRDALPAAERAQAADTIAARARRPVVAAGIAFAAQEIPAVPATPRDAPLDLVLTEREVIEVSRA